VSVVATKPPKLPTGGITKVPTKPITKNGK